MQGEKNCKFYEGKPHKKLDKGGIDMIYIRRKKVCGFSAMPEP